MTNINILFLGASKRVSLIERFLKAAKELNIYLNIFSCEKDLDFYPISSYVEILKGPNFKSDAFNDWLEYNIKNKYLNIIIPNMDSATVSLSRFVKDNRCPSNVWAVVSSFELCKNMEDKFLAEDFFKIKMIPFPVITNGKYPKIVKPRFGYGTNGIQIFDSGEEMRYFLNKNDSSDYIVQDFIIGQEVTSDVYISPKKGLIGYVLRDRLEVSDGEVMVCKIREAEQDEKFLIEKISSIPGWVGCITIQYIKDSKGNLYVIEINPRFGGGATCTIEAGLNMPLYILSEYLGKDFELPKKIRKLKMTRARRDFFNEL